MQDINADYETWDKKRLVIGVVIFLIFLSLALGVKSIFLDKNNNLLPKTSLNDVFNDKVKGVNVEEQKETNSGEENNGISVSIPGSFDIKERLEVIKKEVNTIDVGEIASSSPQIQKVLTDLKNLEEYPKNQVKEACYNICKGL